jgi:pectate lyase
MKTKQKIGTLLISSLFVVLSGCNKGSVDTKETIQEPKKVQVQEQKPHEVMPSKAKTTDASEPIDILHNEQENTSREPAIKFGNVSKGQKIYSKRLKASCGMGGGKYAQRHTQKEWIQIADNGNLAKEITTTCNGIKIKDRYLLDISAFLIEYASDSGNIPANCS